MTERALSQHTSDPMRISRQRSEPAAPEPRQHALHRRELGDRDLVRHRDSAAREAEHHGIGARMAEQLLREQTARAAPIGEHPRSCQVFVG